MNVFERKKTLVLQEKFQHLYKKFLTDTPEKTLQNILHIFSFQNIIKKYIVWKEKKQRGVFPPPTP